MTTTTITTTTITRPTTIISTSAILFFYKVYSVEDPGELAGRALFQVTTNLWHASFYALWLTYL